MHKPGTGRTSAIPEILGRVNHNHSAEIRISLNGSSCAESIPRGV